MSDKTTNVVNNMAKHRKILKASTSSESTSVAPDSADELKQLHVNIPATLHKKFRIKVLQEGRSMNRVIEDLIESYVSKNV